MEWAVDLCMNGRVCFNKSFNKNHHAPEQSVPLTAAILTTPPEGVISFTVSEAKNARGESLPMYG